MLHESLVAHTIFDVDGEHLYRPMNLNLSGKSHGSGTSKPYKSAKDQRGEDGLFLQSQKHILIVEILKPAACNV